MQLVERVQFAAGPNFRIDPEAGVVYGVKILGEKSRNGHGYPLETRRKAAPLYEGMPVNIDHVDKTGHSRSATTRFGVVKNPTAEADGNYAEIHYLKSHPFANQFVEAAQRMPQLLGMSHHAEGELKAVGGVKVVAEITKVRSVDVVADPATVNGLFEDVEVQEEVQVTETVESEAVVETPAEVQEAEENTVATVLALCEQVGRILKPAEAEALLALKPELRSVLVESIKKPAVKAVAAEKPKSKPIPVQESVKPEEKPAFTDRKSFLEFIRN